MSNSHTPTRWKTVDNHIVTDNTVRNIFIASCGTVPIAEHIVRCVNSHDALVAALEACLKKGSKWHPTDPVIQNAKAALKSAKE